MAELVAAAEPARRGRDGGHRASSTSGPAPRPCCSRRSPSRSAAEACPSACPSLRRTPTTGRRCRCRHCPVASTSWVRSPTRRPTRSGWSPGGSRPAGRSSCFVAPRVTDLSVFAGGLTHDLDGATSQQLSMSDLAFHALREYVPGDDLRHVHWRSSAKAGELLVRQYHETHRGHVTVLVDGARASYAAVARLRAGRLGGDIDRAPRGPRRLRHLPALRPPRGHVDGSRQR